MHCLDCGNQDTFYARLTYVPAFTCEGQEVTQIHKPDGIYPSSITFHCSMCSSKRLQEEGRELREFMKLYFHQTKEPNVKCLNCENERLFHLIETRVHLLNVGLSGELECGELADESRQDRIQCAQCGSFDVEVNANRVKTVRNLALEQVSVNNPTN